MEHRLFTAKTKYSDKEHLLSIKRVSYTMKYIQMN